MQYWDGSKQRCRTGGWATYLQRWQGGMYTQGWWSSLHTQEGYMRLIARLFSQRMALVCASLPVFLPKNGPSMRLMDHILPKEGPSMRLMVPNLPGYTLTSQGTPYHTHQDTPYHTHQGDTLPYPPGYTSHRCTHRGIPLTVVHTRVYLSFLLPSRVYLSPSAPIPG